MRGKKTKRNILIISLVAVLFLMGIGYAAFQTNLTIKGTGTIASNWDIEITGVSSGTPIGHAENASTPTYSALTANMEANLYDKGSAMEYDVTIENKGDIDATLNEIQQSTPTNDAIKISVTGYTKGEVLSKHSLKNVKVKIEYDENYKGEVEVGTRASLEVTFIFGQADTTTKQNGEVITTGKYKLSFDCKTNGSSSCSSNDEYYKEGDEVDLTTKTATNKKGYTFKGWGTTQNATSYITSYTMTDEDKTLYAIYEAAEGPSITNVSTTATTSSITAVVTATGEGLTYEYSKDGGDNWTSSTDSNTYTFNYLNQNTEYEIVARVTNSDGATTYSDKIKLTTKTLDAPTFAVKSISGSKKSITITYPEITKDDGSKLTCSDGLTCSYSKNGLEFEETTTTTEDISFKELGTLVAKVTDGTNTVNNTYTAEAATAAGKLMVWSEGATTDFHSSTYKEKIKSIDIVDYSTVPEDAIESWNVSAPDSEGIVNAWVIDDPDNNGRYKLYIGSKNGVIANEDSSYLFEGFTEATSINLSLLDTSNVSNMEGMFTGMTNLTSLDLSDFDTSKVTNMSLMFRIMESLNSIDLSSFNTSKVTNMERMFNGCISLASLNLSNFDTSKVTSMADMFGAMTNLVSLDLSNFDTTRVTDMSYMFNGMTSLTTIYVSDDFVTTGVTTSTSMFLNPNLVGENGTRYDSTKTDKTYARIDTTNNPGYFTDASMPTIDSVNTTSTINSITVVTTAHIPSAYTISKIEYSNDGGITYTEGTLTESSRNNYTSTYTFTGLTHNTSYRIKVKATINEEKIIKQSVSVTTSAIPTPTYTKAETDDRVDVTITYPSGNYTFQYSTDGTNFKTITPTNNKYTVSFTEYGTHNVIARVTDGTNTANTATSTYTVKYPQPLGVQVLASLGSTESERNAKGLYRDTTETNRYIFKGNSPQNYISFNSGQLWRIYSVESDGSIKIIFNGTISDATGYESSTAIPFDTGYGTATISGVKSKSSVVGTRYSSSAANYCYSSQQAGYSGCNAWGSASTTLDSSGRNVTAQSSTVGDTSTTYTLPEGESLLNVYLNHQFNNETYKGWVSGTTYTSKTLPSYYSLDSESAAYVKTATWNIGTPGNYKSTDSLATIVKYEKYYKWNGKVGLLTASEVLRANSNTTNCSTMNSATTNSSTCTTTNYLNISSGFGWIMSPSNDRSSSTYVNSSGGFYSQGQTYGMRVRPVVYLCKSLELDGEGTSGNRFTISGSCSS